MTLDDIERPLTHYTGVVRKTAIFSILSVTVC